MRCHTPQYEELFTWGPYKFSKGVTVIISIFTLKMGRTTPQYVIILYLFCVESIEVPPQKIYCKTSILRSLMAHKKIVL